MIDNERKRIIPNEVLLPEVARLISEGHTVTLTVRGNSMNRLVRIKFLSEMAN